MGGVKGGYLTLPAMQQHPDTHFKTLQCTWQVCICTIVGSRNEMQRDTIAFAFISGLKNIR